jgi:AcrR family transcriptional regulator
MMMNGKTVELSQSQRILDAAFQCISTRGYANVSLRDIAEEAGVVLSQLNYYYKNKEGLFTEVVKMLAQQYLREIEEILKNGESGSEKIACLIRYFQSMLRNSPELFKLLFDLSSMALWSDSLRELLNNLFKDMTGLMEKYILCSFSEEDKLKSQFPVDLPRIMLGALFGTSIQVILAKGKEDMIDSLAAIQGLFNIPSENSV